MTRRVTQIPRPDQRMTAVRKAAIVRAVEGGHLTLAAIEERYAVGAEEFLSWMRALHAHGPKGLRISRLQHYGRHMPAPAVVPAQLDMDGKAQDIDYHGSF